MWRDPSPFPKIVIKKTVCFPQGHVEMGNMCLERSLLLASVPFKVESMDLWRS
ncbi:hypothetical protein DPMN_115137 [Dreissena polymorpha]|uniref:Uncharacterized protein n=1 Tax=Dreissena polymorpha TaxID=45954 RepID=A0A9D4QSD2_DREPO|nr:hypothetical protein DPMN_115137 [Dreissena polymorpha]